MEAVAIVSSLVIIISLVSTATKAAIDVYGSFQDAQAEVTDFTTRLLIVTAEITQLQSCGPEITRTS